MITSGPIIMPLWGICNQYIGTWIIVWIIVPILWKTNAVSSFIQNLNRLFDFFFPSSTSTVCSAHLPHRDQMERVNFHLGRL